MIVWLNAWPMCSVPVTFGGGSWIAKEGAPSLRLLRAAEAGDRIAAPLPLGTPVRLDGGGFEGFGKALEAGLGQGVAHGGAKTNGIPQDAACGVEEVRRILFDCAPPPHQRAGT